MKAWLEALNSVCNHVTASEGKVKEERVRRVTLGRRVRWGRRVMLGRWEE